MQVNKDDIVSIKGNLYQYINLEELCDLVCPTCHTKYDSSYYQKYSLTQIKNELIRAHKLNKHLRFYIQTSLKMASIFVNKAINAGFDCRCAEIINKKAPIYIMERNEYNGRYICSTITAMDIMNLPKFYLYELNEDNLLDLDVNYITFDRFFDGKYAFEVTNINIQCLPQSNLGTDCFVKQPESKTANITIRLSGNTELDEKLKEYLYGDDRYSADAQIHLTGDPDLLTHYRLSFLSSIEHAYGLDDECLILEYLVVDSADMNIAYRRDLIYGDFCLPRRHEICSIPPLSTVHFEGEIQRLEIEQKLKEYGLDKIDLDNIMQGIDYSYKPDEQDFVTFNKADVEFQYNMYNIIKEKENDIMKINNKNLKQIIIDEDRKTVTTITIDEQSSTARRLDLDAEKHITVAKASDGDEFDPYVGVAMTLAYQLFGSKENFRKFVRESEVIKNLKKEREAREAAKKEEQEKKEKARKRAEARRAKRAAKRAERDEKIATNLLQKLVKFLDKTDENSETENNN